MVRGPAALLGLLAAGLAYLLAAPALPVLQPDELAALVACAIGIGLVVAIIAGLVATSDARIALGLALLGAALIAAGLNAAGVAAAATPFEAVAYGCAGVAFALVFDAPAVAIALPLFIAGVDLLAFAGGAGSPSFGLSVTRAGDALGLELPAWGGGGVAAGRIAIPEVVFVAAYATYARRSGLRERPAEVGMAVALLVAAAAAVLADARLPTLALIGAGYLLPNADRLRALANR
ncbi:MAG: hypothetical protein ABI950_08600 [Solirubrobacteraceae bacterium]